MTTTTTTDVHIDPSRRHEFVLLFDVKDGNPNGDPDAGNFPRLDPETMQGLVTDVAIKRKIRDWVDAAQGDEQRFKIYVQRESYLTEARARVFDRRADGREDKDVSPSEARTWMCQEFYDIRMFGAVMSMKQKNAGQVRGPVQMTFARSQDPIVPLDVSIARVALERGEKLADQGDELAAPTHGTFGRKALVPYGLYRTHGFFSAHFAKQTGVTSEDLDLFWKALVNMWDLDRSSSRGYTACRGLWVFSHSNALGEAPAHTLLERVIVTKRDDVDAPRSFSDYEVTVEEDGVPTGTTLTRLA